MDEQEALEIRTDLEGALRTARMDWLIDDLAIVYEGGKQREVTSRKNKREYGETPRSRTEEFSEREKLNILLDSLEVLLVEVPGMARDTQEIVESVAKSTLELEFGSVDEESRTSLRSLLNALPDRIGANAALRHLNEIRGI